MENCDDCVSRVSCPAKGLICNDYVKENKAFEITKNVKTSSVQTLQEVRAGCYGKCEITENLQAEIEIYGLMEQALKDWLKYLENYDPYAPNSVSRYGAVAAGIDKTSCIERLMKILALKRGEKDKIRKQK